MRRGASAKFKIGQPEKAPPRQSIDNAPVSVDQKLDAAAAQKEAADDAEAARKGLVVAYAKQMKEKKESLEVDEASKQRKAADALAEKVRSICTHADIHCGNARMDDDARLRACRADDSATVGLVSVRMCLCTYAHAPTAQERLEAEAAQKAAKAAAAEVGPPGQSAV